MMILVGICVGVLICALLYVGWFIYVMTQGGFLR
jgi:hypothetical protein